MRLRSTFNCSTLASEPARVMCAAMKKYGLIFADNGSPWYVSGEATSRYVQYQREGICRAALQTHARIRPSSNNLVASAVRME